MEEIKEKLEQILEAAEKDYAETQNKFHKAKQADWIYQNDLINCRTNLQTRIDFAKLMLELIEQQSRKEEIKVVRPQISFDSTAIDDEDEIFNRFRSR